MNAARLALLPLLFTLAACERSAPATATPAPPPAAERERELLAFAEPTGHPSVDSEIRRARARVQDNLHAVEGWVHLGRTWVRKARLSGDPGFYLNAEAAAEGALAIAPNATAALNLEALVLLNAHRFREAELVARRVLAVDPDDAMALGSLSDALLELGDLDGAERAVEQMMARKPNLPSYSRASYLRWLRGDTRGAIDAMRLAHDAGRGQRDPEPSAWALTQLAWMFWHAGDLGGAETGFELALSTLPGYAPARVGRARVRLASGRAREAIGDLEAALADQPLVETAWLLLDARRAAGDRDGAERARAEVVRLGRLADPRSLALFLATQNESPGEALRLAERELADRPGPMTREVHAFALLRAGRAKEAALAMEPVRALGWREPGVIFRRGLIALANGQRAQGRALLEEALALNPHFDLESAREAREVLAR